MDERTRAIRLRHRAMAARLRHNERLREMYGEVQMVKTDRDVVTMDAGREGVVYMTDDGLDYHQRRRILQGH